jgi:hypothetical protein
MRIGAYYMPPRLVWLSASGVAFVAFLGTAGILVSQWLLLGALACLGALASFWLILLWVTLRAEEPPLGTMLAAELCLVAICGAVGVTFGFGQLPAFGLSLGLGALIPTCLLLLPLLRN